jgi:hypothetical protein
MSTSVSINPMSNPYPVYSHTPQNLDNIMARTVQKIPFLCCCIQLSWKHASLRSRYVVTAVVYLLIPLSLPSNGSACGNTVGEWRRRAVVGRCLGCCYNILQEKMRKPVKIALRMANSEPSSHRWNHPVWRGIIELA